MPHGLTNFTPPNSVARTAPVHALSLNPSSSNTRPEFATDLRQSSNSGVYRVVDIDFSGGKFTGTMRDRKPLEGVGVNIDYKEGKFSGTMRNDKPLEGTVTSVFIGYKRFSGAVKEGALAYPDRDRLPKPGLTTPFQQRLRGKPPASPTEYEALRQSILNYGIPYEDLTVDQKFNINNDNQRRYFDTIFAANLLSRVVGDTEKAGALRHLTDNLLALFKSKIVPRSIHDWERACKGQYVGEDGRLQQLSTQAERVSEALSKLDLSAEQKQLCTDLYTRRYLNYLVDETQAYRETHPVGIIKSKSNPQYLKRGRLDGDFAQRESLHPGILRNVDACTRDLQFDKMPEKVDGIAHGMYTRCPDRLHMADPGSAIDADPDSWLSRNFLSGNTPYVNGLSGSMLIEIGGINYVKEVLNLGPVEEDFLAAPGMMDVVSDYFRAMASMYTFVDGGHSLFEIQSSFKQTWVKPSFVKVFKDPEWANVGQDLYDDRIAFRLAWKETQKFDTVLQNRQQAHLSIRDRHETTHATSSVDDAVAQHVPLNL